MFKEKNTDEIMKMIDEQELEEQAAAINKSVGNAFKNFKSCQANISNIDQESLNIQTDSFNMNIKNDEININAKEKDNHTLEDLEQKLINDLYDKDSYGLADVEIMEILFKKKKEN